MFLLLPSICFYSSRPNAFDVITAERVINLMGESPEGMNEWLQGMYGTGLEKMQNISEKNLTKIPSNIYFYNFMRVYEL